MVSFRVFALLCGTPVLHAFHMQVSEEQLYWTLATEERVCLFSIFNYAHEATQAGLLSILASPTYEHTFRSDYAAQTFSEAQALDLIGAFWEKPTVHPLVFPPELILNEPATAVHLLASPAAEYNAGVRHAAHYSVKILDGWLSAFIQPVVQDPMLCGDESAVVTALDQEDFICEWVAFNWRKRTLALPRKDSVLIMLDYYRFRALPRFQSRRAPRFTLLPDVVPGDDPARLAFASLCHSNDLPQFHAILSMLKQSTAAMSPTMQSLWHGKLLHLLLHRVIEKLKLTPAVVEACEFAKQAVFAFLAEYDVRAVPPFVMEALIHMLSRHASLRLSHVVPEAMHGKLMLLDQLYPTGRGFWGGLDRYIARWKANMSTAGLYTPPKDACTLWEAIEVWAEVGVERSFGIISPVFTRPFVIRDQDVYVKCVEITHFLEVFTHLLIHKSGILEQNDQGFFNLKDLSYNEKRIAWRGLARTIAYNLLYFGEEKFNLGPKTWFEIYNPYTLQIKLSIFAKDVKIISRELKNIGCLLEHIPVEVMMSQMKTRVIPTSTIRKHKESSSLLTDPGPCAKRRAVS